MFLSPKYVGHLLTGCLDVVFLSPKLLLTSHFLKNVLAVNTSEPPKSVVGLSKGMLLVKYFLCQSTFMEIIGLSQTGGKSGHPHFLGMLPDLKQQCAIVSGVKPGVILWFLSVIELKLEEKSKFFDALINLLQ